MDAAGVAHAQTPKQFRKSHNLGVVAGFLGAVSGSIGQTQAGRLLGAQGRMSMTFASVQSARPSRRRSTIYLNEFSVFRQQVYVDPQDFDFVLWFIRSHVPAEAVAKFQG